MKKIWVMMVAFGLCGVASAALVVADFNDLSTGDLNGQGGGSGFSGNYTGATNTQVIAGNLTSSLYDVSQSGTAQSIKSTTFVGAAGGQIQRDLDSAMGGTIWISMLGENEIVQGRGGFSLNPTTGNTTANAFNVLFFNSNASTADVRLRAGSTTLASDNALSWSMGSTGLFLLRIQVSVGGNETLDFWLNPNVSAYSSETDFLANVTPTLTHNATDLFDSVSSVGVFSYTSGATVSDGATLDNFRMSNDSVDAFKDVTGIPEPATIGMLGLGVLLALALRRRMR
ncbi:MAG: PEP-CTERM sorting domain-containing protein [Kiritimatiellales bacterium]|nr:PEP-CTERM sorting domain-containing protein [Kiritimatiellales bacterium]